MSPKFIDLSHPLDSSTQVYPGDPQMSTHPCATIPKDGYNVTQINFGTHTGTHLDAPYHFIQDGRKVEEILLEELVGKFVLVDLTSQQSEDVDVGDEMSTKTRELKERQRITWEDHILPSLQKSGALLNPTSSSSTTPTHPSILLIRTGWSKHFNSPTYFSHPYLTRDAAQHILEAGFRVIGVDTASPDETPIEGVGGDEGFGVHEVVLGAGCMIVENLTNLGELASAMREKERGGESGGGGGGGGGDGDKDGDGDGSWIVNLAPLRLTGCDGSPIRAFAFHSSVWGER